jgi:hypothetical protein
MTMKRKMIILVVFAVLIAVGLFSCGRTQQDSVNGFISSVNNGTDPSMYFYTGIPNYANINVAWMQANFDPLDRPFSGVFTSSGVNVEYVSITSGAGTASYRFDFVKEGMDSNISNIVVGAISIIP